jgi:hypothetical protein
MFLLYHFEGCNSCGGLFRKCYVNDLHTTTCSGMLDHRTKYPRMLTTYKSGFIWGVGTGDKINIYNDLWICSNADRKIILQRGNIIF